MSGGRSLRRAAVPWLAALLVAGAVAAGALAGTEIAAPVEHRPAPPVQLEALAARSKVVAADGSVLGYLHAGENRIPADLSEVPRSLVHAVIATEDASFLHHGGVDVRGVVRAVTENLDAGRIVEGASTITQQLAKFELGSRPRGLDAKVRETGFALRLERQLDKREILERYLNAVYLGRGTYGVAAAAEHYFDRPLRELDPAQSALLAGLIASPEEYDPFQRPEVARKRRRHVLRRMVDQGDLTRAQLARWHAEPLPDAPHPLEVEVPDGAEYFLQEVKRRLLRDERLGETRRERYRRMFAGGLTIHTTIDPDLQERAAEAVREELPESPFTAALVAIEPSSGAVRALVGGPRFADSKFNLATQGARQPGSAFKVVTLATALEAGYSPEDLVDARSPCELPQPHHEEPWKVRNYGGARGSIVPVRVALERSLNCAFARLVVGLGPGRVVDVAHRLGIERELEPFPAITLGAQEVTPLGMTSVFATLAADGLRRGPVLVDEVIGRSGEVVSGNEGGEERAVGPQVARWTTDVLRGVIERGTGTAAALGRPAAGKTGTSQEWRNAWFGGYTPQLAAAVWMGAPEGEVSMSDVGGIPVTGGSYPAAIWSRFMAAAHADLPVVGFRPPDPSFLPDPLAAGLDGRSPREELFDRGDGERDDGDDGERDGPGEGPPPGRGHRR